MGELNCMVEASGGFVDAASTKALVDNFPLGLKFTWQGYVLLNADTP